MVSNRMVSSPTRSRVTGNSRTAGNPVVSSLTANRMFNSPVDSSHTVSSRTVSSLPRLRRHRVAA